MATEVATPASELAHASGQFSTFYVADMFFGVDVLQVQEVLRAQQMSPVPQAPDVIEGLINLRGQIVTAIDMRRQLLLPPRDGGQAPMNMVVRTLDGVVSLLVDEIGDVLAMDASTCERPPENLDATARELIRGVYKLKDKLLLVLDTERAVEVDCTKAPRRKRFDGQSSEGISNARQQTSSDSGDASFDALEAARSQGPGKKGNRKAAVRNANGATRLM
jgi:purine-binding chemotaxis protein CheW